MKLKSKKMNLLKIGTGFLYSIFQNISPVNKTFNSCSTYKTIKKSESANLQKGHRRLYGNEFNWGNKKLFNSENFSFLFSVSAYSLYVCNSKTTHNLIIQSMLIDSIDSLISIWFADWRLDTISCSHRHFEIWNEYYQCLNCCSPYPHFVLYIKSKG